MNKINFKITTPEKIVYEDQIDQVTLPTKMGEITVLPGHLPIVSSLKAGEILIKKDGQEVPLAVAGGFIELNHNQLVILADNAERAEEIDEIRAEEARQRVAKLIEEKKDQSDVDYTALAARMERELARLKVARKYKNLKPKTEIRREED
ncbi:MAG: ATP synthase F1 subunit epsilon [Candidatus Komeilibacteria bacterium CG10_big_fil_rev_8_21_14_0_10_41_13]|uniref:ATP synthase epsilon chain n=1 Tax=Candidatus Komeilibacteria bacterium CG10_big_fil_rev_8_21_14_0_10_41_13 TaxID=1974476 RepID=A0A2M6WBW4_9BACT|nr:MAG: ATP synthase F1 subunit epsilon [Candidatus Komeilibacteria bacterium CG10_big_fil_rev_8_21_14_0_10_41_13]